MLAHVKEDAKRGVKESMSWLLGIQFWPFGDIDKDAFLTSKALELGHFKGAKKR